MLVPQLISSRNFISRFNDNIEVDPEVERELLHLDFTLYSAGQDLAFFVKSQMPSSWMSLSQYTNLDNGFGVFSSIGSKIVSNIQVSTLTKQFLALDSLTRDLNFVDPLN